MCVDVQQSGRDGRIQLGSDRELLDFRPQFLARFLDQDGAQAVVVEGENLGGDLHAAGVPFAEVQSDADFQKQVEKIQAEMSESPTDPRIPKRIGDLYFEIKKDYAGARDWYKKASQLAPQDSVLKDKVDDCSLRLYELQYDNAKKANDPKAKDLFAQFLKFKIQSYERRVSDRPTDMGLRFELGKVYYAGGLVDQVGQ